MSRDDIATRAGPAGADVARFLPFSVRFLTRTAARRGARPRARMKLATFYWASQIALALLIAVGTGLLVLQLRRDALIEADRDLRSLSLILADQAERAFEAVDLIQTEFLSVVQADNILTPEAFRQLMSSPEVNKEMDDHGSALAQLDVLGLVDADGNFVNVTNSWPTPKVNIADRDHFKALKADPMLTTYVTDPIMNRITHTMAVVVAHRISGPNHVFLGISFGGVLMSYFEKLYQTVTTRPAMSITLFRKDGILLAHYPDSDKNIGRSYAQGGIVGFLIRSGVESAAMEVTSPFDGLQRLVAGHALSHYPMLVTVSRTVSSILAPWRQQATYLIGAAILLELVISSVVLLLIRHFRGQSMLAEANAARSAAEAELALSHERERADRELHTQNVRFGAALDNMSQALCMFDTAGSLVVANRRLAWLFGLPEIERTPLRSPGTTTGVRELLLASSTLQPEDIDTIEASVVQLRAAGKRTDNVRELSDGRSLAMNFAPMADDGWLVTWEDITERRRSEARIAHMAHHDALTGLPNRVRFHDRLAEAVARGRRGDRSAVLFLDLDHFKAVNDTLGHPAGDELLKEVARRLLQQVREIDTVARLGGDEFAIVQSSIRLPGDATLLARRVIDAVATPIEVDGQLVNVGASIGITVIPNDGQDPDQLLKNADLALYQAKGSGRGRYCYFAPEMDARMQARRAVEQDLHKALADGQFEVFYQPLMNLLTRSVAGFEALLRWRHPKNGLVPPSDFIPVAEEMGLIVALGKWVLRQACRDATTWPSGEKLAVNLSPVQFTSPSLVADIAAALAESGLAAARLELEITETVMLEDTEAVLATLHQLRDLGVGIALDDFGTGYSSLSYLQRFPFTKVKIDRSFIIGLGDRAGSNAIVAAITNLCATLGMSTTAEGVETAEQLKHLAEWHCTEAQGYLFSRPRPAGDVAQMCADLNDPAFIAWD
jgi:diguanylate cyclase (GGDEF)-like protein